MRKLNILISLSSGSVGSSPESYQMDHKAPSKDDAPLYDVTKNGVYPDDFYSEQGLHYYGTGEPKHDRGSMAVIVACHHRPNAKVKIYRAVPLVESTDDKISKIVKAKAQFLKTGKVPSEYKGIRSNYYDSLCEDLDKLKLMPAETPVKPKINQGDWVTLVKSYAVEHGRSNLNNEFQVLTKTVLASQLFTDGNSINEWGYWP